MEVKDKSHDDLLVFVCMFCGCLWVHVGVTVAVWLCMCHCVHTEVMGQAQVPFTLFSKTVSYPELV